MNNTIKNIQYLKTYYYKKNCDLDKFLDTNDITLDDYLSLLNTKDDYFKRYKFYTSLLKYM